MRRLYERDRVHFLPSVGARHASPLFIYTSLLRIRGRRNASPLRTRSRALLPSVGARHASPLFYPHFRAAHKRATLFVAPTKRDLATRRINQNSGAAAGS